MDVDLVIEGISDPSMSEAISRQIDTLCRKRIESGSWIVMLTPAETCPDQWDLGLRGESGLVFVSFAARSDQLSELVAEKVTQLFERVPVGQRASARPLAISRRLLRLMRAFQ